MDKVRQRSTRDPISLRSPALNAVDAHVGSTCVTDTLDAKERALRYSTKLQPSPVLPYVGTDIDLQVTPTVRCTISAIGAEIGLRCTDQDLKKLQTQGHVAFRNNPAIPIDKMAADAQHRKWG